MGSDNRSKATIKVVKLDKAFKLAEAWVNNMSGSTADDVDGYEYEGRPSRLGLGAKVVPNANVVSSDPVERKLLGKLNAQKRRHSKDLEESKTVEKARPSDEDDDEPESRTAAFTKKRVMPSVAPLPSAKRSK